MGRKRGFFAELQLEPTVWFELEPMVVRTVARVAFRYTDRRLCSELRREHAQACSVSRRVAKRCMTRFDTCPRLGHVSLWDSHIETCIVMTRVAICNM